MKRKEIDKNYERYRNFPLYVILVSGLIVLFFGLYLVLSNSSLPGRTLPNERFGQGGGNSVFLNGYGLIIIGIGISIFPSLQLMKKIVRKGT
ncbi:MAG: hypothetical protein ACJ75B_09810 [Flavisolibacter sp.]